MPFSEQPELVEHINQHMPAILRSIQEKLLQDFDYSAGQYTIFALWEDEELESPVILITIDPWLQWENQQERNDFMDRIEDAGYRTLSNVFHSELEGNMAAVLLGKFQVQVEEKLISRNRYCVFSEYSENNFQTHGGQ